MINWNFKKKYLLGLYRKSISLIISIFCFVLLFSCNSDVVFEKYEQIPGKEWKKYGKINFEVEISDTVNFHNLFINIRNLANYPYKNMFLFIKTTSPNNYFIKDTFECILADDRGKWLGRGLGDIWDNKILYKENIRFSITGTYKFEFEQAMRIDLPSIEDVGFSIEQIK